MNQLEQSRADWLACAADGAPWRPRRRRRPIARRRSSRSARTASSCSTSPGRATGWWPSANAVSCCTPTTKAKTWTARADAGDAHADGRRIQGSRRPVWRSATAARWCAPRMRGATWTQVQVEEIGTRLAARRAASRRRSLHRLRRVRPVSRFGRCRPDLAAPHDPRPEPARCGRRCAAEEEATSTSRSPSIATSPGSSRSTRPCCSSRSPGRSRARTTAAPPGRASNRPTRAPGSARSRSTTARSWSSACAATSTGRPIWARPGRRSRSARPPR